MCIRDSSCPPHPFFEPSAVRAAVPPFGPMVGPDAVQSRRTSDFGHARMGPKHPHGPGNSAIVVQVRRALRRGGDMGSYQETFRRSIDDPVGFWGEACLLYTSDA